MNYKRFERSGPQESDPPEAGNLPQPGVDPTRLETLSLADLESQIDRVVLAGSGVRFEHKQFAPRYDDGHSFVTLMPSQATSSLIDMGIGRYSTMFLPRSTRHPEAGYTLWMPPVTGAKPNLFGMMPPDIAIELANANAHRAQLPDSLKAMLDFMIDKNAQPRLDLTPLYEDSSNMEIRTRDGYEEQNTGVFVSYEEFCRLWDTCMSGMTKDAVPASYNLTDVTGISSGSEPILLRSSGTLALSDGRKYTRGGYGVMSLWLEIGKDKFVITIDRDAEGTMTGMCCEDVSRDYVPDSVNNILTPTDINSMLDKYGVRVREALATLQSQNEPS